jgi:hypothetical protein
MSVTKENTYVWIMEWFDTLEPSARHSYDVYTIEPQEGIHEEDFVRFMTDELFPVVKLPVDPPGHRLVVRHILLKQVGGFSAPEADVFPDYVPDKSILAKFRSLSTTIASQYWDSVSEWESENRGESGES